MRESISVPSYIYASGSDLIKIQHLFFHNETHNVVMIWGLFSNQRVSECFHRSGQLLSIFTLYFGIFALIDFSPDDEDLGRAEFTEERRSGPFKLCVFRQATLLKQCHCTNVLREAAGQISFRQPASHVGSRALTRSLSFHWY